MNLFLTIAFWYPLYHEFFTSFTKMKPCNPVGWALAHQIFLQRGHGGASPTLLVLIKSGSLSHLSPPYPARLQKQFCEALFAKGRNYPSLTKRGEGRFSNDYVNSILGVFISNPTRLSLSADLPPCLFNATGGLTHGSLFSQGFEYLLRCCRHVCYENADSVVNCICYGRTDSGQGAVANSLCTKRT